MKTIGVIGCGALGTVFVTNMQKVLAESYRILGVLDVVKEHADKLAHASGCKSYRSIDELLADAPDLVVEIAGVPAVKAHAERILSLGKPLVIVSVGALADHDLYERLVQTARNHDGHIYIPNGAVGGFDLLMTYSMMGHSTVSIESRKAPRSLNGAPGLSGRVLGEEHEELVFEGGVQDAITGFPKNVNVAVATSIASSNPETCVRITSVPGLQENSHHIQIQNQIAKAEISVYSKPDPANPRSSTSAAWSVIALLKNLASPISFF